ncbi:MAG: hypothetical protein ACR2FH_04460 [Caulobacteraceae bacterium]
MPALIKSLLALATVLTLSACADSGVCPDGTHLGRFGHHCVVNR